jgi:hypothetical protein
MLCKISGFHGVTMKNAVFCDLLRVALGIIDVSEEHSASIIRGIRIALGTALAALCS